VDGVRLIGPDRLREVTTVATTGTDETIGGPARYGLGFAAGFAGAPDTVVGATGLGGSGACADVASGVAVAVVKNRFTPTDLSTFTLVRDLALDALAPAARRS
jgi:hypothetical protein